MSTETHFVETLGHRPVMPDEVIEILNPTRGGLFVDCTVGGGGHARALLEAGAGRIVALDRDGEALPLAARALDSWSDQVELVHADFRHIDRVLDERQIVTIDGAIADFGMSSIQLEAADRGFSFRRDELLDMRMDRSSGFSAADLLRDVSETTLADHIYQFGEERYSRRIARAIVDARARAPLATTGQLAAIVRRAVPRGKRRIDPATRTFQALRIWVNRELEGLEEFVRSVSLRLRTGARLVVLTFHSLEDRIVKYAFRKLQLDSDINMRVLTKRPLRPSSDEVSGNRRARSAKLRAVERLP